MQGTEAIAFNGDISQTLTDALSDTLAEVTGGDDVYVPCYWLAVVGIPAFVYGVMASVGVAAWVCVRANPPADSRYTALPTPSCCRAGTSSPPSTR